MECIAWSYIHDIMKVLNRSMRAHVSYLWLKSLKFVNKYNNNLSLTQHAEEYYFVFPPPNF